MWGYFFKYHNKQTKISVKKRDSSENYLISHPFNFLKIIQFNYFVFQKMFTINKQCFILAS